MQCFRLCFIMVLASAIAVAQTPPDLDKIRANEDLLKTNFLLIRSAEEMVDGEPLRVEVYKFKSDEPYPFQLFRIQFKGKSILLPKSSYTPDGAPGVAVGHAPDLVLALENSDGGNAWNVVPFYVISLEEAAFLKVIGYVSHVRKENEALVFYIFDDVWEMGLGVLGHAGSPGAPIFVHAKNGRLGVDTERTKAEAIEQINKISPLITKLKPQVVEDLAGDGFENSSPELFSLILQRCLLYRAKGQQDMGIKLLSQDLRFHSDQLYPVRNYGHKEGAPGSRRTIPVDDLERRALESLRTKPLGSRLESILTGKEYSYDTDGYPFPDPLIAPSEFDIPDSFR